MERTFQILKELTRLPGIPGREELVIDYLMEFDIDAVSRRVDPAGNVLIEATGPPERPPVVFTAHTDEVGFRVKRVEKDGTVSVIGADRTDLRTVASEIVDIWTERGPVAAFVIAGQKTSGQADYSTLKPEAIRLDVGLTVKEEVEALGIGPGAPVTYDSRWHELAGGICSAKAFDDRAGVAAILRALELTRGSRKQRPLLLGSVQEEIGAHGADSVAFEERPGCAVVVDICGGEVFGLPEEERRRILGRGPIILDGPVDSAGYIDRVTRLASDNEIPLQRFGTYYRGADHSSIPKKMGGIPGGAVILPMSYYHGPRGLMKVEDVYNAARLMAAILADDEFLDHAARTKRIKEGNWRKEG